MGIFEWLGIVCCALIVYWVTPFIITFLSGMDDGDEIVFWIAIIGCILFVTVVLLWASGEPFPIK